MDSVENTSVEVLSFNHLVDNITIVQNVLLGQVAHAINLSLTARNWMIGCYIVEYEQKGSDRAQYGDALLKRLATRLNTKGLGERRLYEFRQMYLAYPILESEVVSYVFHHDDAQILRLPAAEFGNVSLAEGILRLPTAISQPKEHEKWQTSPKRLFNSLSATHLVYLSKIKEPLRRSFYEQEAIRGCWTIKELDRQVSSLYFERMGLSKNKAALQEYANKNVTQLQPSDIIHNPMAMEFLGLSEQSLVTESKLETAILDHLQQFLLELGNGFCFEARQKRLLIDQDYFKAEDDIKHYLMQYFSNENISNCKNQ